MRAILPFVPRFTCRADEAAAIAVELAELQAQIQRHSCEALIAVGRVKDEFLSIISHELRTPLNSITGFGSILEAGIAGDLNETQLRYVKHLLEGADLLLALVNDLLDMSSLQAGRFSLNRGPVRLENVARTVKDRLSILAERRKIELTLEIAGTLPEICADAQRLEQVLVNLVGNALKFTAEGGRVVVSAGCEGNELFCAVRDTGIGIARADLPRLFNRFEQIGRHSNRQAGGSGLGLSISKALIEAHGGTIGVVSQPGEGSVFWFRVPVRAETA